MGIRKSSGLGRKGISGLSRNGISTFGRTFPIANDVKYKPKSYDPHSPYLPKVEYIGCENISASSTLYLGDNRGVVFHIVGTTTIDSISTGDTISGRKIYLLFDNSITIKDGFNLALVSDFSAAIGDTLCLVCDGTHWYELSRSVTALYKWNCFSATGGNTCSCKSNGSFMASCGRDVHTSTDYGISWDEAEISGYFSSSDVSFTNGETILLVCYNGRAYRSIDQGASYSEVQPAGNTDKGWTGCAVSSSGADMIVVNNNQEVYTSTNSGVDWTSRTSAIGLGYWSGCDISADGSVMIVCADFGGSIRKSIDGGVNWTIISIPNVSGVHGCSLASSNPNKIIVCTDTKGVYTTADGGANWIKRTIPIGGDYYYCCSSDSTGQYLIVAGKKVFISSNYGVNWTTEFPGGHNDFWWEDCAISEGGNRAMVTRSSSFLYYNGWTYIGLKT